MNLFPFSHNFIIEIIFISERNVLLMMTENGMGMKSMLEKFLILMKNEEKKIGLCEKSVL